MPGTVDITSPTSRRSRPERAGKRGGAVLFVELILAALAASPSAPSIALTFDDGNDDAAQNGAILKALSEAKLHSVLFVAGKRVDSPEGMAQVRSWGEAGHLVGNHTYSHRSLG